MNFSSRPFVRLALPEDPGGARSRSGWCGPLLTATTKSPRAYARAFRPSSSAMSLFFRSSAARRRMLWLLRRLCRHTAPSFGHAESHIAVDECAAPEFFSHGAKLVGIEGDSARVTADSIEAALAHFRKGVSSTIRNPQRSASPSPPNSAPSTRRPQSRISRRAAAPAHRHEAPYGWRALRQRDRASQMQARGRDLARRRRCVVFRCDEERRTGRGGRRVLQSAGCRRLRVPAQEGRASDLQDALCLGPA